MSSEQSVSGVNNDQRINTEIKRTEPHREQRITVLTGFSIADQKIVQHGECRGTQHGSLLGSLLAVQLQHKLSDSKDVFATCSHIRATEKCEIKSKLHLRVSYNHPQRLRNIMGAVTLLYLFVFSPLFQHPASSAIHHLTQESLKFQPGSFKVPFFHFLCLRVDKYTPLFKCFYIVWTSVNLFFKQMYLDILKVPIQVFYSEKLHLKSCISFTDHIVLSIKVQKVDSKLFKS